MKSLIESAVNVETTTYFTELLGKQDIYTHMYIYTVLSTIKES